MKTLITTLNSKFIHKSLALRLLYVACKNDHDIDFKEYTIKDDLNHIVDDLLSMDLDILCLSVYIWNVDHIQKLCHLLKERKPELKIIVGGPEVTYEIDYFLDEFEIDYIMAGEGEVALNQLLTALENNEEVKLQGISTKEHRDPRLIPPVDLSYLEMLESPYLLERDMKDMKNRILYFETSRGCPYQCQYCLSSLEKGLRFFSMDYLKQQLKAILNTDVKVIKLLDRSFNAKTEHALEILDFVFKNCHPGVQLQFEINGDVLDQRIIDFINEEAPDGLLRFEIGIQSTYEPTNKVVQRYQNFERLCDVIRQLQQNHKIDFHLDLIAGLPYEGYDSFEKSFNDVFGLQIEQLQLGFLKMIKGTGMRARAEEFEYEYKDYAPYEVLSNKFISYDEILKLKDIEDILERYYNSNNFSLSVKYIIENYYSESAFKFFEEFATYFDEMGYFHLAQGKNQLYSILLDFYKEKIGENYDLFMEILKYDYVSLGKISSVPNIFAKVEVDNLKPRVHEFLHDRENLEKYLPKHVDTPTKYILKYVHFEPFKYDILKLKEDIHADIKEQESIILFVYDDIKVFEKSRTYKVELKELTKEKK